MAVGVKEVARHAGVSLGTVSNVLNRPELVSPATRERVLSAIAELGFVRNEGARALRTGGSRTIGLVVLDIGNPFFTDVAGGVEAVADEHDVTMALYNSGESQEREERHLARLEEQRVRGVLITPVEGDNQQLDRMSRLGIPVVLVDRVSSRGDRCAVTVDDVAGGRLVGEHLADHGHRRIVFVGGPAALPQVADRRAGLALALESAVLAPDLQDVVTAALSIAEGAAAGAELASLPARRRPTAAACANDLLALGLLQGLMTAGLRVPEDMAIVGYDDIVYAAAAAVPLSSVRQPRDLLGRAAAQLLFDELDRPDHEHKSVVFQPELVIRTSSARRRRRPATPAVPGR